MGRQVFFAVVLTGWRRCRVVLPGGRGGMGLLPSLLQNRVEEARDLGQLVLADGNGLGRRLGLGHCFGLGHRFGLGQLGFDGLGLGDRLRVGDGELGRLGLGGDRGLWGLLWGGLRGRGLRGWGRRQRRRRRGLGGCGRGGGLDGELVAVHDEPLAAGWADEEVGGPQRREGRGRPAELLELAHGVGGKAQLCAQAAQAHQVRAQVRRHLLRQAADEHDGRVLDRAQRRLAVYDQHLRQLGGDVLQLSRVGRLEDKLEVRLRRGCGHGTTSLGQGR